MNVAPRVLSWRGYPSQHAGGILSHMHMRVVLQRLFSPRAIAIAMCSAAARFDAPAVLAQAADDRSAPAAEVIRALKEIECAPPPAATAEDLSGRWELVFSTAAAKLPLIDGYMPNREVLEWDLAARRLKLEIETLPLLPKVRVVGEELTFDAASQTLTYSVKQKPPSQWRVLHVDRANGLLAARSSVTGLNLIRKLRGGAMRPTATLAAAALSAAASAATALRARRAVATAAAPPLGQDLCEEFALCAPRRGLAPLRRAPLHAPARE